MGRTGPGTSEDHISVCHPHIPPVIKTMAAIFEASLWNKN